MITDQEKTQEDKGEKKKKKNDLWYSNGNKMASKVKDLQISQSHTSKLYALFWFECCLSENKPKLMSEVNKWLHQRHINDLCVKRSMTVSSLLHLIWQEKVFGGGAGFWHSTV